MRDIASAAARDGCALHGSAHDPGLLSPGLLSPAVVEQIQLYQSSLGAVVIAVRGGDGCGDLTRIT